MRGLPSQTQYIGGYLDFFLSNQVKYLLFLVHSFHSACFSPWLLPRSPATGTAAGENSAQPRTPRPRAPGTATRHPVGRFVRGRRSHARVAARCSARARRTWSSKGAGGSARQLAKQELPAEPRARAGSPSLT
jgi:hypothetical protein